MISFLYIYLAKRAPDQPAIGQPFINSYMRIFEIEKPRTPEQQRLDQLRANSKRARDAVKVERDRQKMQRAQKALQAIRPIKPVI